LPRSIILVSGVRRIFAFLAGVVAFAATAAAARDELVTSVVSPDGEAIPFVLTTDGGSPTHAALLMPGGSGNLSPRLQDGQLVMSLGGNFLIRTRDLFAGPRIVAVSMDATTTPGRVRAIVADLERRFGRLSIYVLGNSRGSYATMTLGERMDGEVEGFVHTSSLNAIASYDTRRFRSRHLIVTHGMDSCMGTNVSAALAAHRSYGTPLIVMEGGTAVSRPCEAYSYHGFYGIERQTVGKITAWMLERR
jgi:NAD(P)-dependent dehydrogenase (short-subunit alcohol dehydrogenase family)